MKYGYARCSTSESKQDIERQKRELVAAGAETVRFEFVHGDSASKPELELLLKEMQEGDTLLTLEVSRLARSTQQLCSIIDVIRSKHLRLEVVNSITIDCSRGEIDPMSAAFLQMAGVFAELELQMIRARVRSGMANAKAKGAQIGRPRVTAENVPSEVYKFYTLYQRGEMKKTEIARALQMSRTTLYKYFDLIEGEKK